MKYLVLTLTLLFNLKVMASADNLGVFHKAEKVVVLVNEARNNRLDQMFDVLQISSRVQWLAANKTFRMSCGQSDFRTACTISFLNSPSIDIGDRDVRAIIDLNDYGVKSTKDVEVQFESSRKDVLVFKVVSNILHIYATKREGYFSKKYDKGR